MDWDELEAQIIGCNRCRLCEMRKHAVPGEGNRHARIMLVGEGPGAQEDQEGRPFVGAAGKLLDRMLLSIGLSREQVYIANVVKCRPPSNRTPQPDECRACLNYLRWQVKLIHPKMVVCLGNTAVQAIMDPQARISRVRGQVVERNGYILTATYHPAALLRDERLKVEAWQDLQKIKHIVEGWD